MINQPKIKQKHSTLKCFECGRTTVIGYKLGIMVFCKACYINNVRAIRRRD